MSLFGYFLVTFSLLSGRPPKSLFRYFFVTLNFSGFRALWDLLPLTIEERERAEHEMLGVGIFQVTSRIRNTSERKRHINFNTQTFSAALRPRVCPRHKLGLSLGPTGLPLCKKKRKHGLSQGQPGLSQGTNRVCPRDKPGAVPKPTGAKSLCLCALFLA